MTPNEKMKIAELLLARAEITGKTLSPIAVQMMIDDLSDLPFIKIAKVLSEWGKTNSDFPYPARIREQVMPVTDDSDDGRDVASRVIAAVSKFGSYRAAEAKAHIGEIGWECVMRMGGWKTFCSELSEDNKGIMNAQVRDLAMTLKKKSMNGTIATPQDFPNMLPSGALKNQIAIAFDKETDSVKK
jgi:hypothetical protein